MTATIMDGVRLSYSIETLKQLVDRPPSDVRVYMGYSGWGPGQLAHEVTEGAWLLGPPAADLVFRVPSADIWEISLRRMGIEPAQLIFRLVDEAATGYGRRPAGKGRQRRRR